MARYWIFAGSDFYPSGGAYDLVSTSHNNLDAAINYADFLIGRTLSETPIRFGGDKIQWSHVFDTDRKVIVHKFPHNDDD